MNRLMESAKTFFACMTVVLVASGCGERSGSDNAHNNPAEMKTSAPTSGLSEHPVTTDVEEHEELAENIVELSQDQIALAGISYGTAEKRTIGDALRVTGTVRSTPQGTASVSMPFGGFIKSTSLLPGTSVRKGQVLATIVNTEFVDLQQNYLDVRHRLGYAEGEFRRHQELFKEDVYSQKSVQQTASEYQSLKAQLRGLEQKLAVLGINPATLNEDNITAVLPVRSPISGHVSGVNVNLGKYVSPTDVLFTIVGSEQLILELTLFENDARTIASGSSVHFTVNNEKHEHSATVYQVGSSITASRTYLAYATVRPPCPNLLPGMYVNARIERGDRQAYVVPKESVVSFNDVSYVLVFERQKSENGKPFTEYRFIKIRAGASREGMIEISPLEEVDLQQAKLVIKGAYALLSAKRNAGEMTCG